LVISPVSVPVEGVRNSQKFQEAESGDTLVPVRSAKVEGMDVSHMVLDMGVGRMLV
jgi:hypothetical protein